MGGCRERRILTPNSPISAFPGVPQPCLSLALWGPESSGLRHETLAPLSNRRQQGPLLEETGGQECEAGSVGTSSRDRGAGCVGAGMGEGMRGRMGQGCRGKNVVQG